MAGVFTPPASAVRAWPALAALLCFLLGACFAAAVVGLVLGLAGHALLGPWPRGSILAAILCLLFAAHYAGLIRAFTPVGGKEIGRHWLGLLPLPLAGLVYGLGLGPGFLYRITHAGYYVLVVGCFALGDPLAACLTFGVYGAARSGPLLVVSFAKRLGWPQDELLPGLDALATGPNSLRGAVLLVLGAWLGASAFLGFGG